MLNHKKLITYIILSMIIVLLAVGCSAKATPTELAGDATPAEDFVPVISVTGKIVPVKWSNLSVSTSGVIAEVLVEEGQKVEAGQVLIRLEGTESQQAAIAAAKEEVVSAQQALDDLNTNVDVARGEAYRAIADAQKAVRTADRQLYYFNVPATIRAYEMFEAVDLTKKRVDVARKAWNPYKYEEDTIWSNPARKKIKDALDDAEGDYRVAMLRIQYGADLKLAEAKLKQTMDDYEKMKDGPDPKQLALAQARLERAQASLKSAQAALDDLELKAPFAGVVSQLNVRPDEWISPGQNVLLLADLSALRVETTDLSEIDVAQVSVGAPVTLTFDALPEFSVPGKVVRISPKNAEGSGVNYTVLIDMDKIPDKLLWGMTAFADIAVSGK
jgi:multidrug efflux pump subunit AcrA (membrane-fusion protein)